MRILMIGFVVLVVAACGGGDPGGPDLAVSVDLSSTVFNHCVQTCPSSCGAGFQCILPDPIGPTFNAFCAPSCDTSDDCVKDGGSASHCMTTRRLVALGAQPFCWTEPAQPCSSDHSDCRGLTTCATPEILSQVRVGSALCGYERIRCPNGCVEADGDAGLAAHCR